MRLPITPNGRRTLRDALRVNGSWDFPDGAVVDSIDWDELAIELDRSSPDTRMVR